MKAYRGIILSGKSAGEVKIFRDGLLLVDGEGKIQFCGDFRKSGIDTKRYKIETVGLILPGFIDMHTHLPQFRAVGMGGGQLLEWLVNHIFPLESNYSDNSYAQKESGIFFEKIIREGTTTAVIYSAPFERACDIAFQSAEKCGIRAFTGRTMMDINSPVDLMDKTDSILESVKSLISKWHGHDSGRLNYILTPRFAGSCSTSLMKKCAEISNSENIFVQTHLSENRKELELMKELHPGYKNYTDIYDKSGLIGDKTLLAHGIYLSDEELKIIKDKGAAIVHCPASNSYLSSGIMPLSDYINRKIKIGIGTDIAGGWNFSMLDEGREALESAKKLAAIKNIDNEINLRSIFNMITINAAETLGINNVTGSLENGKDADFLTADFSEKINAVKIDTDELLSLLFYRKQDYNITGIYVRGRNISIKMD